MKYFLTYNVSLNSNVYFLCYYRPMRYGNYTLMLFVPLGSRKSYLSLGTTSVQCTLAADLWRLAASYYGCFDTTHRAGGDYISLTVTLSPTEVILLGFSSAWVVAFYELGGIFWKPFAHVCIFCYSASLKFILL